ncbi:hypothetical protein LTV02_01480 [Nocardia yamanashiensis]|uniref:hypothetical protein n=1 Tax=Nocardia yamanashiensis TaxID=209247 RepID=UPI001E2CF6A2|nr:hypothetical protein [Nocardia yamanashiensis]UGT42131.1 hypothetical protein LTV02_01480 [Nocardia yamanashiensis]
MEVFRKFFVAFAVSVVIAGSGEAVAQAFTPQDELRFLLMDDLHQSDQFKSYSVSLGHKTCADIDRNGPARKASLIAFDRRNPGTNVGVNGMTATEIDILAYCPQHLAS